jgi:hypothetical protein|tara:strand:- start:14359 stop:15102 length:744 start_codon:yes stop_codon:yes gene_type:complete
MEQTQKFPTEVVDLPSQGKLYPKESPLSSGTIEMKYMTAKEEDILTNQNYIEKGIVVDKLLKALIVDKTIDYNELLVGDKNALLIAARILGYGKDYEFDYAGIKETVDLSLLNNKPLHPDMEKAKGNDFNFTLPSTGTVISFKILCHGDEQSIDREIKGLKKINKESSAELSTRLKYMITGVDGDTEKKNIRAFVDTRFLARDSRAFRNYVRDFQPDVDMTFYPENGPDGGVDIPIGVNFLWPDAAV